MRTAVGVLLGTTRPVRVGGQVGGWVVRRLTSRDDVDVRLLDLQELDLPFLADVEDPVTGRYTVGSTRSWADRVAALDAVVVVTAEYNSGYPAPLKNALDLLGPEWDGLPAAVVGYGGLSAGTRAVAALMPVLTHLGMLPVGSANLRFRDRLDDDGVLRPTHGDDASLDELLAKLLRTARSGLSGRVRARTA